MTAQSGRPSCPLLASRRYCLDGVEIDAGAEMQAERENDRGHCNEKRAAIADGHCINSQQKRPHQQAESTELQHCN